MSVGIDLTGSSVRAVRVNPDGSVAAHAEQASDSGGHPALRGILRKVGAAAGARIGAAVVVPGEDELPPSLASAFKADGLVPVVVAAGAAAAVAETWCGAARGLANVVTFSTGEHVISGAILNGAVWQGAHGLAGSVGWLALNPVEREDYRRHGGLEAEVGATGMVRRMVWRIKSGDRSRVTEQVDDDLTRLTPDHILAGARAGDGVCLSVVRDTARYIGMAVTNLVSALDPEAVVLGGSLPASGDLMLDAIRLECSRRLRPAQHERVRILVSPLGADAVAIGAARQAMLA